VDYGDRTGNPLYVKATKLTIFNFAIPEKAVSAASRYTSIVMIFGVTETILIKEEVFYWRDLKALISISWEVGKLDVYIFKAKSLVVTDLLSRG